MAGETPIPYKFTAPPDIDISVLIPAFTEDLLTGRVIDTGREGFAALSHEFYKLMLCDNTPPEKPGATAAAKGAVGVKEPHNQTARARNTAAKSARGKWLIFL